MKPSLSVIVTLLLPLNVLAAGRERIPVPNWSVNATSNRAAFVAITPCRIVDTRNANGSYGGPALAAGGVRSFNVPAGPCGALPVAVAYSLNLTIANYDVSSAGWITGYATGTPRPFVSSVNFGSGSPVANAAIVPASATGSIDVYASGTTHLIIDINGYFPEPAGTITGVTAGAGLSGGGSSGTVTISANFGGNGVATTVARSDHKHYERTIIVSPSAGGAGLQAAIDGITDASASNTYLVKVEPGIYDVSSGGLSTKAWVDVEGSGEGMTTIRAAATVPALFVVGNPEVRFVTLEHDGAAGPGGPGTGGAGSVILSSGSSARFSHVTLIAKAIAGGAAGVFFENPTSLTLNDVTILVEAGTGDKAGINGTGGTVTLDRVKMSVSGGDGTSYGILGNTINLTAARTGIDVETTSTTGPAGGIKLTAGESASLRDVDASVSAGTGATVVGAEFSEVSAKIAHSQISAASGRGIQMSGTGFHELRVENSSIAGPDNTIHAASANKTIRAAGSQLNGGAVSAATATCAFIWDETFTNFASSCP